MSGSIKGTWPTRGASTPRGSSDTASTTRRTQQAYTLWYYNTAAYEPRTEWAVAHLADRSRMPDTLWKSFHPEGAPTPEAAQAELGLILKKPLDALEATRSPVEDRGRGAGPGRGDGEGHAAGADKLALWLRYERMHDAMFHKSYGALERPEAPRPEPESGPGPSAEPEQGPESESEEAAPPAVEIEAAGRRGRGGECRRERPGSRGSGCTG